MLERGMQPPNPDSGEYCRARQKPDAEVLGQVVCDKQVLTIFSKNPSDTNSQ